MVFKVGDIVIEYSNDRKTSLRGVVKFVGPHEYRYVPGFRIGSQSDPSLNIDQYWILWGDGTSNRVKSDAIEIDKEYLRNEKLKEILK